MKRALLAVLVLAAACRRHRGGSVRVRDPRQEFATGCVDSRYVMAPAVPTPSDAAGAPRAVATAFLRPDRYVAWVTDEGARVWREGAERSLRVTPPVRGDAFVLGATATRLVLAWAGVTDGAVQLATLDAEGHAEASAPLATGAYELALASSRQGALLVWRSGDGASSSLRARLLDASGHPRGAVIPLVDGAVDAPTATWTGALYVVAWRAREGDAGVVRATTVQPDASAPSPAVTLVRTDATLGPPTVAWGGGRLAVAWSDARNGARGLQTTTVDLTGTPSAEPQRLSVRFDEGSRAALAWDGAAFGAAWSEPVGGGNPRAYFALLDRHGRRIGTGLRVMADADDAALTAPALDWERPDYVLAVLRDGREVELRRTGPRGCDMPPYVPSAPR